MKLFKSFTRLFGIGSKTTDNAQEIMVTCNRCGETVTARVNLYNDLSPVYDGEQLSYYCRKVLIGQGRCFQQIEVQLTYDDKRKLVEKQISGGKFVER
jgi:hypothetical protein